MDVPEYVYGVPAAKVPRKPRIKISFTSLLVVVYVCVLIYAALPSKRDPQVLVMWLSRAIMTASRQGAYALGRVAIGAEHAYWLAAERVRGGY